MLYIVGTPIGNKKDISSRALEVLARVDAIACEDTRRTGFFLSEFSIKNTLISYHEHNRKKRGEELICMLREGRDIALVSDAGMPCVSDPGEDLVRRCREEGLAVSVVPGPAAAISALCLSGFSGKRFVYEGFLPPAGKERKERLHRLLHNDCTFILYEAPHRLVRTLKDMTSIGMQSRRVAFCREMTKKFEEVRIMTIEEAIVQYSEKSPKGEFVLVVEKNPNGERKNGESPLSEEEVEEKILSLFRAGFSTKDISSELGKTLVIPKKEAYRKVLDVLEQDEKNL